MSIEISSYDDITNEFVSNIPDDAYITTKAYKFYGTKEVFCEKTKDCQVRYMMLKPCVLLTTHDANNIYNKIQTSTMP